MFFWGGTVEWDQHDCDFLTEDPLVIDMIHGNPLLTLGCFLGNMRQWFDV